MRVKTCNEMQLSMRDTKREICDFCGLPNHSMEYFHLRKLPLNIFSDIHAKEEKKPKKQAYIKDVIIEGHCYTKKRQLEARVHVSNKRIKQNQLFEFYCDDLMVFVHHLNMVVRTSTDEASKRNKGISIKEGIFPTT